MHPLWMERAQSLQTKYHIHKVVETENNEQRNLDCTCLVAAPVQVIERKKTINTGRGGK